MDCNKCEVDIEDDSLQLCLGDNPLLLDTLVIMKTLNAPSEWSISELDPFANLSGSSASIIQPATGDTTFDASDVSVKAGYYELMLTVTNKGVECSDSFIVVVDSLPKLFIANDTICKGDPLVTFTAAGTWSSLKWNNDATETGPTFSTLDSGKYELDFIDENGCAEDTVFKLVWDTLPEPFVDNDTICFGSNAVEFDAGIGWKVNTWTWGSNIETTQKISVTGLAGDTIVISLAVEDDNGCKGDTVLHLIIDTLPVPDLGKDTIICATANPVVFNPGIYTTYSWTWGTSTKNTPTISTKVADTYEVEVTDNNGCKGTDDVKLTVIAMPAPAILIPATKCPGSSHTFDVTAFDNGNGPYKYVWHDGSTGSFYDTKLEESVWVDITDDYGCTGRDNGSVKDNSNLTVLINDGKPIHLCEDEDVLLIPNYKASNGYNFTWSNAGSGTSENLTASVTGKYELHVDNGGGCEGDSFINVTVHLDPILVSSVAGICDGEAALIGGDNDLGGTYTYAWNTGETSATISVLTKGIYTQTVTSDRGCVSSETVDVDVYANPVPDLGVDIEVCTGIPVTFQDVSGTPNLTFVWSNGSTDPTISPIIGGTYSVIATTPESCTGTDDVELTFIPIPQVDLGIDTVICQGETYTIDAGNPGLGHLWSGGETSQTITVAQTGTYSATVSESGCSSTDAVDVFVVELPTNAIDQSIASQPYCFNELERPIKISAGTSVNYDFLWGTGEDTIEIEVTDAGTYVVQISAGKCSISDKITLRDYCPTTLYVPNSFTPNGDGNNDSFNASGTYVEDYEMYIYNRWGELIYKSSSMFDDWNGTYKGNNVQMDVYVYKIYYTVNHPDGNPRKETKVGTVTLVRYLYLL